MEHLYLTQMLGSGSNPLGLPALFDDWIASRRCLLMDYRLSTGGIYDVTSFDAPDNSPVIASVVWRGADPVISHPRIIPLPAIGVDEALTQAAIIEFELRLTGQFTLSSEDSAREGEMLGTWLRRLLRLSPAARANEFFHLAGYRIRID